MSTISKRLSVSIPTDIEKDLDKLKQEKFYNNTKSEMMRHLIRLGLQSLKNTEI